MMRRRRPARGVIAITLALLSTGCTVGPDFVRPEIAAPAAFGTEPADVASRTFGGTVDVTWWRRFDDPELASLIDRLAVQSIDLQVAAERIVQARAQRRVVVAEALPRVDAAARFTEQRDSENSPLVVNALPAPGAKLAYGDYRPQLSASWEPDLFGRIRRSAEAADAAVTVQIEDRHGIALAAIAELAQDYLQLRQMQLEEQIVRRNIAAVRTRGALVRQRFAEGAASALDVAQTDAQLSTIQQNLPDILLQQAQLANAIALLLAAPPRALAAELAAQPGRQPLVPPAVPIGLPSDLARRRPDIREAEASLHVATAQTGVAVAAFYPSFSLTGSAGYDSLHRASLFDWASRFFMISPVLSLPIFHGGELSGTLALRQSQQRAAALDYRKTVLQAWHDVDNALTGYAQAQQLRADAVATDAANQRALLLAEQLYRAGATDYLDVIAAQTNLFGSETVVAQANARIESSLVALYKALGGGWQAVPDPLPDGATRPSPAGRTVVLPIRP